MRILQGTMDRQTPARSHCGFMHAQSIQYSGVTASRRWMTATCRSWAHVAIWRRGGRSVQTSQLGDHSGVSYCCRRHAAVCDGRGRLDVRCSP